MNRVELIEKIADEHELSKAAAGRIVDSVFDNIKTAVKKGEGFQLIGFGSFKVVSRAARKGFNPAKGVAIKVPARKVPKFVPGAAFKALVDGKAAAKKGGAAAKPAAKKAPAKKK